MGGIEMMAFERMENETDVKRSELLAMCCNALNKLDGAEYPDTVETLAAYRDGNYTGRFDEPELELAAELEFADARKQMPEEVACVIMYAYLHFVPADDCVMLNNVGSFFYNGRMGKPDYEEAMKYYRMSSDLGYPVATSNLAGCYYYGCGTPVDYQKAHEYFTLAMLQGDDEAIWRIGDMYHLGQYVEQNDATAAMLYHRAYDTEPPETHTNPFLGIKSLRMADIYYFGYGVEQNLYRALVLYHEAEERLYVQIRCGDKYDDETLDYVISQEAKVSAEVRKIAYGVRN